MYRKIGLLKLFHTHTFIFTHKYTLKHTFCTKSIILFSKDYHNGRYLWCDRVKSFYLTQRPDREIANLWLTHVGEMEIKMQILFLELQRLSKNGIPSIVVRYHNETFRLYITCKTYVRSLCLMCVFEH